MPFVTLKINEKQENVSTKLGKMIIVKMPNFNQTNINLANDLAVGKKL